MTNPPMSRDPEPGDDPDDLPEVFHGLIGIDVVDGELLPRAGGIEPRRT